MDRATDALVKAFGEDEERGRKEREKAALAAVLLDRNGKLLEENSVAVSSFGWALPIALTGKLEGLGAWSDKEKGLVEDLTKQLTRTDRQGNQLPLDVATLEKAFKWLVAALNLDADFVEPPTFVLRVYHYFKSKNPPEVALLNSFYLGDLAKASNLVARNQVGMVLARYLGAEPVEHSPNMLGERSIIERLVAPSVTPASRWPAPGGHPLVTLQQAAVNAARSELLSARGGIVAVNGPPGTGKTTLLRDIVASCVLDRAKAMAAFDDPLAAFKITGQKVAAGDRAFLHLYSLDDSLKGHEVVVASSNNKAVENVSRELPALKAVGRDVRYFRTVSDRLMSRKTEDGQYVGGEPTWGLIAAVLGNALNRGAFQQALWWDDDRSLRLYLKAAKGDSVVREVKDEAGQVIRREIPSIIETETPPDPEQAKVNWRKVKAAFKEAQSKVVRWNILDTGSRIDGRDVKTVRPIVSEVGVLPRTHGSALFTRGETQALVVATLGTGDDEQFIDALEGTYKETFLLHYNFPPYSVGETGRMGSPGRREIGHGKLAWRAVHPLLPPAHEFPYTIRVVSEITESNGSSSMASVCGASLSLMDAGVPLRRPVAGIAMGLILEGERYAVLSDILGDEDHLGDMDFKVAGTEEGITSLQMDIKIAGITEEIMRVALAQAKDGRAHILVEMAKALTAAHPRVLLEQAAFALFDYIETHDDGFRILLRDSPPSAASGTFASLLSDVASQVEARLAVELELWQIVWIVFAVPFNETVPPLKVPSVDLPATVTVPPEMFVPVPNAFSSPPTSTLPCVMDGTVKLPVTFAVPNPVNPVTEASFFTSNVPAFVTVPSVVELLNTAFVPEARIKLFAAFNDPRTVRVPPVTLVSPV